MTGGHSPRFEPGPSGYWTQAWYTTINAALNAVTFGRKLFLEGRRKRGAWHNWTHGERITLDDAATPDTEAAIIDRILSQPKLRVIGSGHSFNTGVRGESVLSLDRYVGVIDDFDHAPHVEPEPEVTFIRVRAGMRTRDITRELRKRGLAIKALPSHDAQSIAGVLSSDVHGTGREIGFVSASVVGLRVIDGHGSAHDVWETDPLFGAAIGGIGAVGVITEVSLRCVAGFNLHQRSLNLPVADVRRDWQSLLADHDHMSLYVFPFASQLQVHLWDRTDESPSRFAGLREFRSITWAALGAAWLGDAVAWSKKLPRFADKLLRAQAHSDLVLESAAGFNRSIYHMHQELEFAAPIELTWTVIDKLNEIYESMYTEQRMPFTLLEVRFTPANGTRSLLSPGAGDRAHVWVTLVCNQSQGFAEYFAAVEEYLVTIDARPHLGKWCERYDAVNLAELHGVSFTEFHALMAQHDPDGRFANGFTEQVFGSATLDLTSSGSGADHTETSKETQP